MSESDSGKETPTGQTSAPADEQPAGDVEVTRESDPGVGPAHYPGTSRGEDLGDGNKESGRDDTGTNEAGRPTGESDAQDTTTINPQEGPT